jgi:hypothetical protein
MTDNTFIDLLGGFIHNGNNKGELTFVGSGQPPHPQLFSDDEIDAPKNPWVTAVEYHLKSIIRPNVFSKMRSISSNLNDRNLWKLQGPKKVPGTTNKYLIYFQFLSWAKTLNPSSDKEEVVVGQVSIVFDKFNGIIKDSSQPPYSKYQVPVPLESYSNYLTQFKLEELYRLLNKNKPKYRSDYLSQKCQHNLPSIIRIPCMAEKKLELDFRPEELVDFMTHTQLTKLNENHYLNFIGINKVSICYPNHRLGCSHTTPSYGEFSYPLSENSPDQLADYINNIVNVLSDDQVYLHNRWKNGCFNLNLAGLPKILYDQSTYQFKVSEPTDKLFKRSKPTTNELVTLSQYVSDQVQRTQ